VGGVGFLCAVHLFYLFKSLKYLEQYCLLTISSTEKASLLLLSVPIICSVKTTLQTIGTLTQRQKKAQLLGSRLTQWNLIEKVYYCHFYRKRLPERATCYSIDGGLVY